MELTSRRSGRGEQRRRRASMSGRQNGRRGKNGSQGGNGGRAWPRARLQIVFKVFRGCDKELGRPIVRVTQRMPGCDPERSGALWITVTTTGPSVRCPGGNRDWVWVSQGDARTAAEASTQWGRRLCPRVSTPSPGHRFLTLPDPRRRESSISKSSFQLESTQAASSCAQ